MADDTTTGMTVGSLLGVPLGRAPDRSEPASNLPAPPASALEGHNWSFKDGSVGVGGTGAGFNAAGVEALTYNNPFSQDTERVWYQGRLVFAVDLGAVDVDPSRVKVAQEYQLVYSVTLNEQGKAEPAPEMVPGQYNIYDSVPGDAIYSPIWQFNYVIVPRDYRANSIRSEDDCHRSGYRIVRSNDFEN